MSFCGRMGILSTSETEGPKLEHRGKNHWVLMSRDNASSSSACRNLSVSSHSFFCVLPEKIVVCGCSLRPLPALGIRPSRKDRRSPDS